VIVSQPAYSPDLSSCDVLWFQGMNPDLKGSRFAYLPTYRTMHMNQFQLNNESGW